ncbi:L,D-transpeptidase family protein [Novosphingobium sp. 1949]|uniref:L,D-transpeptidase family protein n=1 Tax=Novosphingobium organovorum TaxID=2930092 RepID=A0ABT0BCP7_9SPHN|nr:L,D-transpeptidase family protein [Novosphingobium organovorum]MCJ2182768.1 L,D-transpeptidase family protein [Novosphingobium organovorum]
MSSRLFLLSGLVALALIGVAIVLAAAPRGERAASLARVDAAGAQARLDHAASAAPKPAPSPASMVPADAGPFVIKRILPIKGAIKYGEWHWDESGAPQGPIVITVDLEARVLSVFRDGYEIGASAVLLGTQDKPTPLGVFPITQKDKDHVSNIYTGAPMPYMQRLTNDGITLHGSDHVQKGYASHGCVGMPVPFAAKLFAVTKLGDRVYVTRGKRVGLGDDLEGR